MNESPILTLKSEPDPRVGKIITFALILAAIIMVMLGYYGQQQQWWDKTVAYVLYGVAVMDGMMGAILPRMIAAQANKIAYCFMNDRLEVKLGERVLQTIAYDGLTKAAKKQSERQKYAGRTDIVLELDTEKLKKSGCHIHGHSLRICNVSTSASPLGQIQNILDEYRRAKIR